MVKAYLGYKGADNGPRAATDMPPVSTDDWIDSLIEDNRLHGTD
jgi:hypothetical protein